MSDQTPEPTTHEETPVETQAEHDLPVVEPETVTDEIPEMPSAVPDPNAPHTGPSPEDLIGLLQENLNLTRQLEEARRNELYAQAEYQNYRRQSDKRYLDDQKYKNADLLKDLLPVLDNFERALAAAEKSQNFEALIGGIKGTLKQLQTALEKAGAKPIEAIGKEFDPKFHEAIGHAESEEYPSNTVAEELQRGYTLHDRVLRPSMVRVTD